MPLSKIQSDVLRVLASHRDPESYVVGATPLNRTGIRYSHDIDVFHDRAERVEKAAIEDSKTLECAGYTVIWRRQMRLSYTAEIRHAEAITDLEWVVDSDFRFFPTIPDELFGYILHPVDLAANKVMAAAGRSEVRDLVDLLTVHEQILPLGAVIWAAVDKAPGFTPEGVIAEIRRNSNYPAAEWQSLATSQPLDPKDVLARLRAALTEAEGFVKRMPTEKMGLLFLQARQRNLWVKETPHGGGEAAYPLQARSHSSAFADRSLEAGRFIVFEPRVQGRASSRGGPR